MNFGHKHLHLCVKSPVQTTSTFHVLLTQVHDLCKTCCTYYLSAQAHPHCVLFHVSKLIQGVTCCAVPIEGSLRQT